jgi:hypothetical protein
MNALWNVFPFTHSQVVCIRFFELIEIPDLDSGKCVSGGIDTIEIELNASKVAALASIFPLIPVPATSTRKWLQDCDKIITSDRSKCTSIAQNTCPNLSIVLDRSNDNCEIQVAPRQEFFSLEATGATLFSRCLCIRFERSIPAIYLVRILSILDHCTSRTFLEFFTMLHPMIAAFSMTAITLRAIHIVVSG